MFGGSIGLRRRGRLGMIRSFAIYYGAAGHHAAAALSTYDLAIIEPRNWKLLELQALRSKGTRVFGYFSVMEAPEWNEDRCRKLHPSDQLLDEKGTPLYFEEWKARLMDLRSPRYRSLLLEELGQLQAAYPLDGMFLDTVGDIEEFVPEPLREEMSLSYRKFLAVAKGRFPQLRWIQNRGFRQLAACAPWLDGMLWEGWDGNAISTPWTEERLTELEGYRKSGLTLLAVSADPAPIHKKTAAARSFIHATAGSAHYDTF